MFLAKRKIKNRKYYYLEESLSLKHGKKRIGICLGENAENIKEAFYELCQRIAVEEAKLSLKQYKPKNLSFSELIELERIKLNHKLLRKYFPESFTSFDENEFIRYAQGSASVEGNSLSLQEAALVLTKGISVKGKTIDEVKEIQNMKKAAEITKKKPKITERLVKKIHAAIMDGFPDKKPGEYRDGPIYIQGSKVKPPKAETATKELKYLIEWIEENIGNMHPIELAAEFHSRFEVLHPFWDGNGRTGREILNLMLQKENYPRLVINLENRESYIRLLERMQLAGQHQKFTKFIYENMKKQAKEIEGLLKENEDRIIEQLKTKNH